MPTTILNAVIAVLLTIIVALLVRLVMAIQAEAQSTRESLGATLAAILNAISQQSINQSDVIYREARPDDTTSDVWDEIFRLISEETKLLGGRLNKEDAIRAERIPKLLERVAALPQAS